MMSHSLNGSDATDENTIEAVAEIVLPSAYSNGGFVQVRAAPVEAYAELAAAAGLELDVNEMADVAERVDAGSPAAEA